MLHTFRAAWEMGIFNCAAKYAAEFRRVELRTTIDNHAALIIIDWLFFAGFLFTGFHTHDDIICQLKLYSFR